MKREADADAEADPGFYHHGGPHGVVGVAGVAPVSHAVGPIEASTQCHTAALGQCGAAAGSLLTKWRADVCQRATPSLINLSFFSLRRLDRNKGLLDPCQGGSCAFLQSLDPLLEHTEARVSAPSLVYNWHICLPLLLSRSQRGVYRIFNPKLSSKVDLKLKIIGI